MSPLLRAALAALALALTAAAPAAADPCNAYGPLPDGDGRSWDRLGGGELSTTANTSLAVFGRATYDRGGTRRWDDVEPGFPEGCTQPSGTDVAYPPRLDQLSGVEVSQITHVSAAPDSFVRHLTILRNPGLVTRTIDLWSYFELDAGGSTDVAITSSGDAQATAADSWVVAGNGGYTGIAWQALDNRRRDSAEHVVDFTPSTPPAAPFKDGDGSGMVHFNVILEPGERKTYMQLAAVRSTAAAAQGKIQQLVGAPAAVFSGIDAQDLATIQNWLVPDADADGVPNAGDGCPFAPDPAQADADGDGRGDACDTDDDGDGLSDETEAQTGTSPVKADSDGDGVRDDADRCPQAAGADAGCPAAGGGGGGGTTTVTTTVPGPPVVVPAPVDRVAPTGALTGVPARMKLAAFRRGVLCSVTPSEPSALACRLLVKPRSARLAAAGDLELASGAAALGSGARSVRLRAPARLLRRVKRLRVTLEAVLTDASGNRTTLRRTIRVG